MSQIAQITVFDGATTPVSHILKDVSVTKENGVIHAVWREQIPTLPHDAQVTASLKLQKLGSGVWQWEYETQVPVMESVSGNNSAGYTASPRVAYVDRIFSRGFAHPRSTVASRRLSRQLHLNLGGNISTSVTPVTTGPIPELIDQLIAVS